jgi:hypothetical protein
VNRNEVCRVVTPGDNSVFNPLLSANPGVGVRTMKNPSTRLMYVECKATGDHRGRARICRVRYSKSGRTIYLGGLELQSQRGAGILGNYINTKTGIEYWVSGPKRNGRDRHWVGGGEVRIDPDVVDEYWRDIRECDPPENPFIA